MLGKTHFVFSIVFAFLVSKFFSLNPFLFILISAFSSFLPDLDHPKSKINNFLKITKPITLITKHRGFFHSIWAPVIIIVLLPKFLPLLVVFAIFTGYISHILLDASTKQGINFLHPISTFHIRGPFKTGKFGESFLFFILCIIIILFFIYF